MNIHRNPFAGLCLLFLLIGASSLQAATVDTQKTGEASLWKALATPGHVALIRHALAPGFGDPEVFALGDCSTQRNLSPAGREQARLIGDRFRLNGMATAAVYTSQWCRCKDTATLLGLGSPNELPLLNSFFAQRSLGAKATTDLGYWLQKNSQDTPIVMVTHQVNITSFTNVYPDSGEIVVVKVNSDRTTEVIGTIATASE